MPGRLFFQQLPSAEPLLDAIVSVCRHHNLSAATFSLTGALSCVTVGTFDQQQQVYVTLTEETSLEILSCTGTVCIQEGDPELSATILVSDITGKIIGGRLFSPTHGEAVHLMLQELIAPPQPLWGSYRPGRSMPETPRTTASNRKEPKPMSSPPAPGNHLDACVAKMRAEALSDRVINTFSFYYQQIANGANGIIHDRDITALDIREVREEDCFMGCQEVGQQALPRTVRILLNGGLGTTMGLTGAKSLIQAKEGLSFLEILLAQAERDNTALCLMNSFSTHEETLAEIARLKPARPPLAFVQNKFPKILKEDLRPATWPKDPKLEWNPPGHGDIYISLYASGLLQRFLDEGIDYAFISNSDNLGASIDLRILGFFVQHRIPFMMEVARRKPSDAKGGHLARHRNGRMILRESAQCPPEEMTAFQDISRYRFFNTNNIWIHLPSFKTLIEERGIVPLPLILNSKPLDPRDESSPPVYQVETAMGAAICLFDKAMGVSVPRSRFLPVKSCSDLLSIRSDRYLLTPERHLIRSPAVQTEAVRIHLDPAYYKRLDNFERRFPKGPPSLVECRSLRVSGDVVFGQGVRIVGDVTIENRGPAQIEIPDGAVIASNRIF